MQDTNNVVLNKSVFRLPRWKENHTSLITRLIMFITVWKTWYAAWKCQLWSALDMSNWETYCISSMPHDAGGTWDCFFKSVSHQLYGMEELHFQIRRPEIDYWRGCPEFYIKHFSESTRDNYIHRMSEPGTWCDNIIIQAMAMLTVVLFTSLSLLILNQI